MKKPSEKTRLLAQVEWLNLRVDGMIEFLKERRNQARKHKGGVK